MTAEEGSLLGYTGLGGIVGCCLLVELLGGAAVLGGIATALGLSTGLTYLVVIGAAGALAATTALGYRQFGPIHG